LLAIVVLLYLMNLAGEGYLSLLVLGNWDR
jgi:hypothetical protein